MATGHRARCLSVGNVSLGDPIENERLWRTLPQPHWVALSHTTGNRRFVGSCGGGCSCTSNRHPKVWSRKVFYSGFDGSWRWRYGVAERYHQKYWHQIAEWIMERPFAVSDDHISIDAEQRIPHRRICQSRVRLRDAEGRPISEATAEALV